MFAVVACGVMVVAVLNALSAYGATIVESTRAHIAADAAALAGVHFGEEGSRHLAEANGAELLSFRVVPNAPAGALIDAVNGGDVEVRVRFGSEVATAYAAES